MAKSCPDSVDVTDLQFKLQCRLKVFENVDVSTFSSTDSLLTCASRYGLLFLGTNSKHFQVVQTQKLYAYTRKDKDVTDYPRRYIELPSCPKHLCVNCDSTIIAVVVEKDQCSVVIFYDVSSFLTQNIKVIKEIRLSSTPKVYIREINWNPSLPAIFTACKSDGTLGVYELKGDSMDINELPAASAANCFCWSPKGKQIAVGSKDGKITQYKPDLKAVKVISEPPFGEPHTLISLQWVSNYQFIGVYQSLKPERACSIIVVDAPKTGEPFFTNYDDICFSGSSRPPQFYLVLQQTWNILMVASANSNEVGVLGNSGDSWTQWIMSDTGRAELPLSQDHQETLPVGLTFDISSTSPLPWGESSIPPCPLLGILSHQGVLCCFNVVYLKEGIPSVCTPPDALPDTSGLNCFVTQSVIKTSSSEVTQFEPTRLPPAQLPFSMGTVSETVNLAAFKDTSLPAAKVVVPVTAPTQSTPLVASKGLTDSSKVLFGSQATLSPIKPQQSSQGVPLFGGQTLITPISKGINTISLTNPSLGHTTSLNTDKYSSIFTSLNPTTPANTVPVKPIVISGTLTTPKPEGTVKPSDNQPAKVTEDATTNASSKQITTSKEESQIVDPKLKAETSAMLSQMIKDEWLYLEAELNVLFNQGRTLKISVGTDKEKVNMITQIESLQEFVKEAVDSSVGQSSEIHCLKQNLIQSWAWFEEANSHYIASKNETVTLLLKLQPLDSVSQKRLKDIEQLTYYIESQLQQTSKTLDEQWGNFQDYAKKTHKVQMPTMEAVFQTMVRQSAILQKQTYILKDISMRLKKKTLGVGSLLLSIDKAENLADDLRELSLDPNNILQLQYEKIKNHTKILTSNKSNMLRALLKQREVTHITASRPQLSSWTLNQSPASRMRQSVSHSGAQISPVSKKSVAKSLSFIQSTPLKLSDASKLSPVTFSFESSDKPNYSATSNTSPAMGGFVSLAKSGSAFSNSQGSAFAPIALTPTSSAPLENLQTTSKTNFSVVSSANTSNTIPSVTQSKPSFSAPSLFNTALLTANEQAVGLTSTGNQVFKSIPDTAVKPQPTQSTTPTSNLTFSFGPSTSTKGIFGAAPSTANNPTGSHNLFSSSLSSNSPFSSSSLSNSSANIKPIQVTSTSAIFGSQQSSFASLSKAASVTTITTTSFTTPPRTSSGVASIFANLQSVIDKATGVSGATTASVDMSKPTLTFGMHTGAITATTQSFGSVSSTSTPKTELGTTTFSSVGGLFGSISKSAEPTTAISTTSSIFSSSSNTKASTAFSFSKPETSRASFDTSSLLEHLKPSEISTDPSLITSTEPSVIASAAVTNKSPVATTSMTSTNESSTLPTTATVPGSKTNFLFNLTPVSLEVSVSTSPSTSQSSTMIANTISKPLTDISGSSAISSSTSSGTVASIFGTSKITDSTTPLMFGTTNQSASIFGNAPSTVASSTTESNIFGANTPNTKSSNYIFAYDNSGSIFGSSEANPTSANEGKGLDSTIITTTSAGVFGTSASGKSIFAAPAATNVIAPATTSASVTAVSAFGTPSTTISVFETPTTIVNSSGTPTTTVSTFGIPTTVSAFGTPTTSSSIFSPSGSIFANSTVAPASNIFGTPTTANANVFGPPSSTSSENIFGSAAPASTAQNIFGGTTSTAAVPFGTQSGSIFGAPKTTGTVFGQQSSFGNQATTTASIFGQPTFSSGSSDFGTSTTTTSGNIFGNATSSSVFGTGFGAVPTTNTFGSQATTQASPTSSFGFGTLNVGGSSSSTGSIFGSSSGGAFGETQVANPFGKVETKPAFGPNSTSIFGNSPSGAATTNIFASPATTANPIFGSNSSTTFGTANTAGAFGSPSTFGSSAFGQKPAFGQSNTFGSNTFGSPQPGAFSGGGASPIAQSGFGSPASYQKPSGFGSPPVFGGSPTSAFGASPSFGGAPAFGSAPAFGNSDKIFGSPQATATGFGAPATQQTASFGNLASQNTIGFGSLAQQTSSPTSSPFSSGSSSFSSWR